MRPGTATTGRTPGRRRAETAGYARYGSIGRGWSLSVGHDVQLKELNDGTRVFYGPSGSAVAFAWNGSGFISPTGIDATLCVVDGTSCEGTGTLALSFHKTGERFDFRADGRMVAHVDRNGQTISLAYTANGGIISVTDTQGRVTNFDYDATGSYVDRVIKPNGEWNLYVHNAGADIVEAYDYDSKRTVYAYDGAGNLVAVTDPLGHETRIGYDAQQRVVSVKRITDPATGAGFETTYAYHDGNTVSTDANGHTTTYHYDHELRVTRVVDALGHEVSTSYTANSNVQDYTSALGLTTRFGYDGRDNLTSATIPTGAQARFEYGNAQHPFYPSRYVDPQANTIDFGYDNQGNLTSGTNELAADNTVQVAYNPDGTIDTVTDGKGTVTGFGYDAQGNLTSVNHPAPLGDITIAYDSLSRVTSISDGKNQTTSYAYDPLDRVTQVTYHDGSTVSYVYDGNGNRTSRTDGGVTSTYSYDPLNRLTQEILPSGATSYGYDPAGNMTSISDAGGTVTYLYDADNLVTKVIEPDGAEILLAYDADHNRTATTYPNGVQLTASYDDAGRITEIVGKKPASGTILTKFTYTYAAGTADTALRQTVIDKDGNTTTYSYDVLNRLTRAETKNTSGTVIKTYAYAYDGNSNRTRMTVDGQTTTYTYNAANQLTAVNGSSRSYDGNGNWTGGGGWSLQYDARDHTTSIDPPSAAAVAMDYAGETQWERLSAGSTAFHTSVLGLATAGSRSFTRDDAGGLLSMRTGSGSYYYLVDALGSVAAVTDSTGAVAASYQYSPFGQITASTGTLDNPWQFVGAHNYHYDAQTGLYKVGLRYFQAETGRWTQLDPLWNPLQTYSWNRYVYVGDDPTNLVDPSGMFALEDIVEYWSVVESAGLTVAFATLAIGGTATCVYFTAGLGSVACASIFLVNATAAVGFTLGTYYEARHLRN